jgi:hypothetical protein
MARLKQAASIRRTSDQLWRKGPRHFRSPTFSVLTKGYTIKEDVCFNHHNHLARGSARAL